jgi:hypothetical protein
MKYLSRFQIFESSNSSFVKDFLTNFGMLISLNFSQITKMGKDTNSTDELIEMMKQLRKPIINGKNYCDFLKDNIDGVVENKKLLSALFVKDDAKNKKFWIEKIDGLKKDYLEIIK